MPREIGIIGVGDMGGNIAQNLHRSGFSLVLYDRSPEKMDRFKGQERVRMAKDMQEFVQMQKKGDAVVWMMLPGGKITNGVIEELSKILTKNDVVIDASNSLYIDSISNSQVLGKNSIFYLDVGFGGGPPDVMKGVSLMVGGERKAFERTEEIFKVLSGDRTYGYVGSSGSGQIAKLVHNVIFYAVNPAYIEATELLDAIVKNFDGQFNKKEALRLFVAAPPINGEMMAAIEEVNAKGLEGDASEPKVSGTVLWAADEATRLGVPMPITRSVLSGYASMSETSRKLYNAAKKIVTGH